MVDDNFRKKAFLQNLASNKPVNIIFDTDMGNDIDDALALAMIHSLAARGECKLLGVAVSKDHPQAPIVVDAINTFYGHGDVPVGMVQGGMRQEDGFLVKLMNMTDEQGMPLFATTSCTEDYEPAVSMLRRLLTTVADCSVVMVLVGFSTNMQQLFDSPGDHISSLNGKELFARKVSHVVMMAGYFGEFNNVKDPVNGAEFNVVTDLPAATSFIRDCPVPIFFTPFELGEAIKYPCRSILEDYGWASAHPVVEAYKHYLPMPYDRSTWDLTAVLYAIRPDRGYFTVSEPGVVHVDDIGRTHFKSNSDGSHYVLSVNERQVDIVREVQVELASQPVLR